MQILATRKRDSVSGEEVVVSSSERFSHSQSNTENNCSSTAILINGTGAGFVDLHRKLNRGSNNCEIFSSVNKRRKDNGNTIDKAKERKLKSNKKWSSLSSSSSSAKSPYRTLAKSFALVLNLLNTYCPCVTWEKGQVKGKDKGESAGATSNTLNEKGQSSGRKVDTVKSCPGSGSGASNNTTSTSNFSSGSSESSEGGIDVTERSKPCKDRLENFGIANSKTMRAGIYHEKQVKSLCALHALNNLLQDGKAFKQENLDKICSELDPNSWVNPHKSVFGLGNYDINVIMTALQQKQLETIWFDKRKDPSHELNFENIYGFILNIPSDCRLGWLALPIKRKHWVAIRNLPSITERESKRNNYYNLDSKFDKPESIGTTENLIDYLRGELKSPEKELFLVVTEDIGRHELWRKNPPPQPAGVVAASSSTGETANNGGAAPASGSTHLLPVPLGDDASAGSGNFRRTSNDSGVVDLLPDLRDLTIVDLNKEDLMRRQSSGVWSDLT